MSSPAAISGDFATYRHVQGRKVLQLVIEVPAESAAAVFAALGTPGAGEGIPVALARLAKPTVSTTEIVQRGRRSFTDLPYAQQAAMRCQEPDFHRYLSQLQQLGLKPVATSVDAACAVRELCGVLSRSELDQQETAGQRWRELEADFFAWQRGIR